jgi:uncharacterized protein YceH (UPF0502 family)
MSDLNLDAVEARVLGVLMEKEITTPDAYPLSINAATSGCNQKSNRDPVTTFTEGQVRDALERLVNRTLVREASGAGSRTRRFAHRMDSRLFGTLEFSRKERAVLCVLLLRGPQTPGEIRARTARLADFESLDAVEAVLGSLVTREDGPHVEALSREPGRREVRHRQLFTGAPPEPGTPTEAPGAVPPRSTLAAPVTTPPSADGPDLARRLSDAEARIEALESAVAALSAALAGADPGSRD